MLKLEGCQRVYLYREPMDMRVGFDRLRELVWSEIGEDPLRGGIFVFLSRRRDRVKLLWFDEDGFCIWYKRLEAGTLRVDFCGGHEVLTGIDLQHLLRGMELSRISFRKSSLRCGMQSA